MRFFVWITLILLTAFVFNSCKRYADDDRRYLKTPCGRIAKKWQLYKITDQYGRNYADSVIYFTIPDNNWLITPDQSFTYNGMVIEFQRSKNKLCLETGIYGEIKVLNKPFGWGDYELREKRTKFHFNVSPHTGANKWYFFDNYTIYKMTDSELIFGIDNARAYFKAF